MEDEEEEDEIKLKEDKGEEEDDEKKDEKEVKEEKEEKEEEVHAEANGEEEEDSNVPTKQELKVQIAEMLKEDKDQTLRTVREKVRNSSFLSPSLPSPHRINSLFFSILLFSILVEQAFQQRLIWEEG